MRVIDLTGNIYAAWKAMIQRCHNPKLWNFKNYGGRGITVCTAWRDSFETFLRDMGPHPGPGYSIDRVNNDGPYEPGNCRWATLKEQRANRRRPIGAEDLRTISKDGP